MRFFTRPESTDQNDLSAQQVLIAEPSAWRAEFVRCGCHFTRVRPTMSGAISVAVSSLRHRARRQEALVKILFCYLLLNAHKLRSGLR